MKVNNTENMTSALFELRVSQNNEFLLNAKRKNGRKVGIWLLIGGLFMLGGAILSFRATDTWVPIFFGVFFLICFITSIVMFSQGKYKSENDDLEYRYYFYKDGMQVASNTKKNPEMFRAQTSCLYRSYKNKQYVHKVFEYADRFVFKIYTGSYNFIPQYKEEVVPKNAFSSVEQATTFGDIMRKIFDSDYILK